MRRREAGMFSMGIMEMKVEIVDSIGPGKTHNARGSVGAKYDINKLTVQAPKLWPHKGCQFSPLKVSN